MRDGKYVILCVDDDDTMLESLRIILEANGYLMNGASDTARALELYRRDRPDFIIADLVMECVDSGLTLAKTFRGMDRDTPIFLLSVVGDELCRNADSWELGFSGVLQKPIVSAELLDKLRAHLHS